MSKARPGSIKRTSVLVGGAQVEVSLQRIHTPDAKTSGLKSSSNLDEGNANLNEEHQTRVDSNVDQFVSNIKRKSKKTVDRYGFYHSEEDESTMTTFHTAAKVESKVMKQRNLKELERSAKWAEYLDDLENVQDKAARKRVDKGEQKMHDRVRKGIPNDRRARAWYGISQAREWEEKYPDPSVLDQDTSKYERRTIDEIERDIDRTYPRNVVFNEGQRGQDSLRNILRWYSVIDPDVGYCQGMGFLAGLFILYLDENRAFWMFCAAMQQQHAHKSGQEEVALRCLYLPQMVEASRVLHVFGRLGAKHLGKLWTHLMAENMHPTMYATEWLMTMFCRGFSFDLVTRVMDVYLVEGYKIVYRVGLALIKNIKKKLMESGFEDIMQILRGIADLTDADTVMDMAWEINVTREQIAKYTKEYDTQKADGGASVI